MRLLPKTSRLHRRDWRIIIKMAPHAPKQRRPSKRELVLFPSPKSPAAPARVVITGAGIVTALGLGWEVNADGFRAGRAAFRPVTLFDVARQRTKLAAEAD